MRLSGIVERPGDRDERLAAIFREMRFGLGLSKSELANRLRTTSDVISTMELGRVRALPAWPETVRLISELGKLHRVDARPILARIRDQVGPAGVGQVPERSFPDRAGASGTGKPASRSSARIEPDPAPARPDERPWRGTERAARALSALSAPVILVAGLLWAAQAQPSLLLAATKALPESVARLLRPVADYMVVHFAPRREGLRWIDVSDPRSRKSDKLRQASR